jgi:ABC-type sugar transport system substrate-binding protein
MSANASNQSGSITLRKDVKFNGVKVFSATMVADREQLGEKVTEWIAKYPGKKVTDMVITQSSDEAFHCIAITVFYWEEVGR